MKCMRWMLTALVLLLGLDQARAGTLYSNGLLNGTINAYDIATPTPLSNSFILSSASTLTGAQLGLWVASPGNPPTSVHWAIGTTPFGGQVASGTAGLSSVFIQDYLGVSYAQYESTFSLSEAVNAGTFYLTLNNASAGGPAVYWDETNGPSTPYGVGGSESFQIFGNPAATPEPATLTLLGIGFAGLAGLGWRRRRQFVTA